MFNVKFVSTFDDEQENTHGISTQHYCIHKFKDRFDVIVYPNMTMVGGVSYTVSNKEPPRGDFYHQACFIENAAGKTVEHVNGSMNHVQSLDC